METITLTIPTAWLKGQTLSQDELRQALQLGLDQLHHRQQVVQERAEDVIKVLLRTGQIRHLVTLSTEAETPSTKRQTPPTLPGPPLSDILIAQRRGEL